MIRLRLADRRGLGRPARRRRLRRPRRRGLTRTTAMPYGPHTADDRERMLAALGHRQRRRAVRRHPRGARAPRRSTCPPPEPELELSARLRGLAGAQPDRPRVVPGRRRLPPLEPAGRRPAPPARRVVHGLHAVPARGQPGHAPVDLRVRVAARRARRPRRRVGVALRRRGGHGRGRADDLPGDPARARPRVARRPSALPRRPCATYFGGGLELDEIPLVTEGDAAGTTDLAALERDAGRHRSTGRRGRRREPRLPRAPRADAADRRAGPRRRRAVRRGHRAGLAGRPGAARRVRRGHRGRGGPAARHRAAVRRPVPRHPGLDRCARPPDPRPARGHDHRPRRPARLRHDPARARAGHPARQGGQQHLHEPGAAGPGRVDLPRDARPARPARRRGDRRRPGRRARGGPRRASACARLHRGPYLNEFASACPTPGRSTGACSTRGYPGRPRPGRRRARRPDAARRAAAVRDRADHRATTSPASSTASPRRCWADGGVGEPRSGDRRATPGRSRADERHRSAPPAHPVRALRARAAAAARSRTRPRTPWTACRPSARAGDPAGPARAQRARRSSATTSTSRSSTSRSTPASTRWARAR